MQGGSTFSVVLYGLSAPRPFLCSFWVLEKMALGYCGFSQRVSAIYFLTRKER